MGEIREISIREALIMQLHLHERLVARSMTRHIENRVNSISLYELRTNDKGKFYQIYEAKYPFGHDLFCGFSSCRKRAI